MLDKFNKIYNQIISEQAIVNAPIQNNSAIINSETTTITVDACWSDPEEIEKLKKSFLKKYNVIGTFNDSGDQGSSWTLTGLKKDLKRVIFKYWLTGLKRSEASEEDLLDVLDQEEYQKLF